MMESALLVGATGAVGSQLLKILQQKRPYEQVTVLSRSPIGQDLAAGFTNLVIPDFSKLEEHAAALAVNDVFCCLGTTIKQAGSRDSFSAVDHDMVLKIATLTKSKGARRFFCVSAMGANPQSRFFYNQVKGQTEEDLKALNFSSLFLFRPSLLIGPRKEFRLGEQTAKMLFPVSLVLTLGLAWFFRPIQTETVAKAMLAQAMDNSSAIGSRTLSSREMQKFIHLS